MLVEHLARSTQTADIDPGLFEILIPTQQTKRGLTGFVVVAPAYDSPCEIEHVEFDCGMTQQVGNLPKPFRVFQTGGFPATSDVPKVALFAENPIY